MKGVPPRRQCSETHLCFESPGSGLRVYGCDSRVESLGFGV